MSADRRPARCQCQADTWPTSKPIPPVCRTYVQPKSTGRCHCTACGHDPECHGIARSVKRRTSHRQAIEIVTERAS
jgi:hypothetical protein